MTLQSLFGLGSVIGSFVMPVLADLKGKKLAVDLGLLFVLISNVLIIFGIFKLFYLFIAIGIFLSGFGSIALGAVSFSINSDFFSDDLR